MDELIKTKYGNVDHNIRGESMKENRIPQAQQVLKGSGSFEGCWI